MLEVLPVGSRRLEVVYLAEWRWCTRKAPPESPVVPGKRSFLLWGDGTVARRRVEVVGAE